MVKHVPVVHDVCSVHLYVLVSFVLFINGQNGTFMVSRINDQQTFNKPVLTLINLCGGPENPGANLREIRE